MRSILQATALLLATWLLSWHLALGAAWWALTVRLLQRPRPRATWLAWSTLGALLVPWSVWRYTARVDALWAKVTHGGPEALNLLDLIAVWGLNLVMAAAGLVLGFPEVAVETAMLVVPKPAQVTVPSQRFPACVPEVARVIRAQRDALPGRAPSRPQRLTWSYGEPDLSVRGALALNPVVVQTHRAGDGVVVEATVPVDYPPSYRLVLGRLGPVTLGVEEGLFHALEERGWLFPYELTYRTTVPLDGPLPSPCEAWSVRSARALRIAGAP